MKSRIRSGLIGLVAGILGAGGAPTVMGQAFPTKPVRVIVPYPTGTTTDLVARQVTPRMSEFLGQPIAIENRPGAGGTVGTAVVAKSPPDGYTLLVGTSQSMAIADSMYAQVPYDSTRDFAPVARMFRNGLVLTVSTSLPINSVADLVAYAKANPGKLNYTSSGSGGTPHLTAALFVNEAGMTAAHVPFAQFAQTLSGLISGDIHFIFYGYLALAPHITSGKLRMLAVSTSYRLPYAPQTPTMAEAGYTDFDVTSWIAMYAPANAPKAIVERVSAVVHQVLKEPALANRLQQTGNDVNLSTPEELATFTRVERDRFRKIVAISGAKVE